MILVMAYALLLTASLAAAAAALEPLCRALRAPTRWAWLVGLALTVAATGGALFLPAPASDPPAEARPAMTLPVALSETAGEPIVPSALWEHAGAAAAVGWLGASLLLLALLAIAAWRLWRERQSAGRSVVHGHDVLLTDGVGPAVAGIVRPVALIPRWVLELDDASQRLLVAHEMEHVRARDTAVLTMGALAVALVPWNPLAWWMLRRLRLAVEVDCDRRVLARGAGVRGYAELLLMTARMPSAHPRLLAASLGEGDSDLERRIVAMTEGTQNTRRPMLRRMLLPTAITAGLVLIACETPRPEPVGPSLAQGEQERRAGVITEVPVGRIALARRLSAEDCEPKTIDGKEWVLAACVALRDSASEPHYHYNASSSRSRGSLAPLADSLKRLLDTTERVLRSELEREAVRRALRRPPTSALQPREIELPKSPAAPLGPLAGQEPEAVEVPARIRGAPSLGAQREIVESSAGQLVVRKPLSGPTSTDPITVVVLSSAGRELARERSKAGAGSTALERLDPEDIAAIEVTKSSGNCGDCPRITVTLKAGVTFRP